MKNVKEFVNENSANILTGLGVVGVVSTAVLAAKETPKALVLLEEKNKTKMEELGCELTKLEKLTAMAPAYIPAALTGLATISCILGANGINRYKQTSLLSAYAYLNNTYEEYKRKVTEMFGEGCAERVELELDKEVELSEKYGSLHELRTFYDFRSKRYFEMSMYELKEAEYKINRMFSMLGDMKLNDIYEFLNLAPVEGGDEVGWTSYTNWEWIGYSWIEFIYNEVITDDGVDAFEIDFVVEPTPDFIASNC